MPVVLAAALVQPLATTAAAAENCDMEVVQNEEMKPVRVRLDGDGAPGATATVDGLPAGLSFDAKKLQISGMPTQLGTSTVTVRATSANASSKAEFQACVVKQKSQPDPQPRYGEPVAVAVDTEAQSRDPFAETGRPRIANVTVEPTTDQPKDWTFTPDPSTGVITATAPTGDELTKYLEKRFDDDYYNVTGEVRWNDFVQRIKDYANPIVLATFTYGGGGPLATTGTAKARFKLLNETGQTLIEPNDDFDADEVTNKTEIILGLNPVNSADAGDAPRIVLDGPLTGKVGTAIKPIIVTSDGAIAADSVTGLPKGLAYNPETKTIAGTPMEVGTFKAQVKAVKGEKTTTQEFTFTIVGDPKPESPKPESPQPSPEPEDNPAPDAAPEVDLAKCLPVALGLGIPLLALIPLGVAAQSGLPGLEPVTQQLELANAAIQQQLGIFEPALAQQVADINAAAVVGGVAFLAAGVAAAVIIADSCKPGGLSSR